MKKLILNALIVFLIAAAPLVETKAAGIQDETPAFFLSLEDIPLMPGLEELPDNTLSFDKPEGRIIESYALMKNLTQEQVSTYYKQSLPQFGWGQTAKNKYFRESENLEISFEQQGPQQIVKIMIRPSL